MNSSMSKTRIKSRYWHLVLPHLDHYENASATTLQTLKFTTLQLLKQRQKKYNLRYYNLAVETHESGIPHLDILLIYDKSVRHSLTHFDYLLKHPHITTYRNLNQAILDYGKKQDKQALSNIPQATKVVTAIDPEGSVTKTTVHSLLQVQQLKKDPYRYLQLQMLKDPLHFNLEQYVRKNDLNQHLPSWSSLKTRLKDSQTAAANLTLKDKPGFQLITRQLIQSRLSPSQLLTYDSWSGYQTIVDKLNQMVLFKGNRDPKTLNLLITGQPNTGKSALVWHPNPHDHFNPISAYCSVYPMGMSKWFPKYQSDVYHCIYWNQMKLTSYSYDTILKLLDGSPLDLDTKGSVSRKVDNPLIIMTSNLTLQQMIKQKFGHNNDYMAMARSNLAVRVTNVVVPPKYNLFLLQRLLLPR